MNPINSAKNAILKPEFVFRPAQVWRRMNWKRQWQDNHGQVTLPWGLALEIDASETIGMAITKIGVYDLVVPEAIFRLCDPGETALDVGANIGMNTGALALATGPAGKVAAYEPHPKLLQGLEETVASWLRQRPGFARLIAIRGFTRFWTAQPPRVVEEWESPRAVPRLFSLWPNYEAQITLSKKNDEIIFQKTKLTCM